MKKLILTIAISTILFSCKKENVQPIQQSSEKPIFIQVDAADQSDNVLESSLIYNCN